MTKLSLGLHTGRLLAAATLVASVSCAGDMATTGDAPVMLVIDSLAASSGATPGSLGNTLNSDVITLVEQTVNGQTVKVPTVFNDVGQARFHLVRKNPVAVTSPSPLNDVTINRYRVTFRRADGRNTPGVDVPYGFDGAATVTITGSAGGTVGFELVRHNSKQEPPLSNLAYAGGAIQINTIAEITFYGRDQAGNEVQVTGTMNVNFADFGDPT